MTPKQMASDLRSRVNATNQEMIGWIEGMIKLRLSKNSGYWESVIEELKK